MIHILFTNVAKKMGEDTYAQLLQELPDACQARINRLRRWQDAQRSLFGFHLLKQGLVDIGEDPSLIKTITYKANGKPRLKASLNFNISHSGNITLCATSTAALVGVDIEEMVSQPLLDYQTQFTRQEWGLIINSKDSIKQFYTCWTKKEALVKAIGNGLNTDLSLINTVDNQIAWHGNLWSWIQLPIHLNYTTYLACNTSNPQLHIKECVIAL